MISHKIQDYFTHENTLHTTHAKAHMIEEQMIAKVSKLGKKVARRRESHLHAFKMKKDD